MIFAGIETILGDYTDRIYRAARLDALLTLAATLVLTAGAGLFLYAQQRNRSAFLFRRTAKKTFHYVFMVLTAVPVIFRFTGYLQTPRWAFAAAAAVFCVAGIVCLLQWRPSGVVFSLLSVWISLPLAELPTVVLTTEDVRNLYTFAPASRVALLAAQIYALGRMAALALFAAGLTIAVIVYYAKRRYLFRSKQAKYFTGISLCPRCGMPVVSGRAYCTACGQNVSDRTGSILKRDPLDGAEYCGTCGSHLRDGRKCSVCGREPISVKRVAKQVGSAFLGELLKKVWYVAIPVILIIPAFLPGVRSLTKNSTGVSYDFEARFVEWYQDPSVAEDPGWLADFDRACDVLDRYNERTFELRPGRLSYTELYVYIQYSEATYRQMAVVQAVRDAVYASDETEKTALINAYVETANEQLYAQASGLQVIDVGYLQSVVNIAVDAVRFYQSFLPFFVFPAVLFVLGAAGIVAGIVLFVKKKDGSPFTYAALAPDLTPEARAAEEKKRKAYLRRERIIVLVGVGIAAALFAVSFTVVSLKHRNDAPTAESAIASGFGTDGEQLVKWLTLCETDPKTAREQIGSIETVVEDCIKQMDVIVSDPDADPESTQIANALAPELRELKETLSKGTLPDTEAQQRVAKLILEGLKHYSEDLMQQVIDQLNDL